MPLVSPVNKIEIGPDLAYSSRYIYIYMECYTELDFTRKYARIDE